MLISFASVSSCDSSDSSCDDQSSPASGYSLLGLLVALALGHLPALLVRVEQPLVGEELDAHLQRLRVVGRLLQEAVHEEPPEAPGSLQAPRQRIDLTTPTRPSGNGKGKLYFGG